MMSSGLRRNNVYVNLKKWQEVRATTKVGQEMISFTSKK